MRRVGEQLLSIVLLFGYSKKYSVILDDYVIVYILFPLIFSNINIRGRCVALQYWRSSFPTNGGNLRDPSLFSGTEVCEGGDR